MKILKLTIPLILFNSLFLTGMDFDQSYGCHVRENGKGFLDSSEPDGISRRQEDEVVCKKLTNQEFFFALYDGHGGGYVSNFLKENLHKEYLKVNEVKTIKEKLDRAFKAVDDNIPVEYEKQGSDFPIPLDAIGSTASVVIINPTSLEITIGWMGDSRVIVEKDGDVEFATIDHDLENVKEHNRIKQLNNPELITHKGTRVNGIEVTRAIGDKGVRDNAIIPEAEFAHLMLDSKNKFLIIAFDGIWKTISNDKAIQIVAEAMKLSPQELKKKYPDNPIVVWGTLENRTDDVKEEGDKKLALVARALSQEAVNKGSRDNISVIIVDLSKITEQLEESEHGQSDKKIKINREETSIQNNKNDGKITEQLEEFEYGQSDKKIKINTEETSIQNNKNDGMIVLWWKNQSTMKKYIYGASLGVASLIAILFCYSKFKR